MSCPLFESLEGICLSFFFFISASYTGNRTNNRRVRLLYDFRNSSQTIEAREPKLPSPIIYFPFPGFGMCCRSQVAGSFRSACDFLRNSPVLESRYAILLSPCAIFLTSLQRFVDNQSGPARTSGPLFLLNVEALLLRRKCCDVSSVVQFSPEFRVLAEGG